MDDHETKQATAWGRESSVASVAPSVPSANAVAQSRALINLNAENSVQAGNENSRLGNATDQYSRANEYQRGGRGRGQNQYGGGYMNYRPDPAGTNHLQNLRKVNSNQTSNRNGGGSGQRGGSQFRARGDGRGQVGRGRGRTNGVGGSDESRYLGPDYEEEGLFDQIPSPVDPSEPKDNRRRYEGPKKQVWAEAPGLVTSQAQRHLEAQQKEKAEREKYLEPAQVNEEFQYTGYFIWPSEETNPMDVFGLRLEKLNPLRVRYKVWIEWQELTRSLKISTESGTRGYDYIVDGIKGIRNAIREVEASGILSNTLYLVTPPTAGEMRTIVRPKIVEGTSFAKDLELAGECLSKDEQIDWDNHRRITLARNRKKMQSKLSKTLMSLAPLKLGMRMRIHFGHLVFLDYRKGFAEGKLSFEQFSSMMGLVRTTASLQRKLEGGHLEAPNLLLALRDWTTRYRPLIGVVDPAIMKDPSYSSYTHKAIVFFDSKDSPSIRLEMALDHLHDHGIHEYQTGEIKAYQVGESSKRLEIANIDIKSHLDWSLEVVSEQPIDPLPVALISLAEKCIPSKKLWAKDVYGLQYPEFAPRSTPEYTISKVIVRSVSQFMNNGSDYIIDLSVDRSWGRSTPLREPAIQTNLTLYGECWDYEMRSIENTSHVRDWDKTLSQLLSRGSIPENHGLQGLADEIEHVKDLMNNRARRLYHG